MLKHVFHVITRFEPSPRRCTMYTTVQEKFSLDIENSITKIKRMVSK